MQQTLADKLQFLAEKAKDGQTFEVGARLGGWIGRFVSDDKGDVKLHYLFPANGEASEITIGELADMQLLPYPRWRFTKEQREILEALPSWVKYIRRNDDGRFFGKGIVDKRSQTINLSDVEDKFPNIKATDEKECNFRKMLQYELTEND